MPPTLPHAIRYALCAWAIVQSAGWTARADDAPPAKPRYFAAGKCEYRKERAAAAGVTITLYETRGLEISPESRLDGPTSG